MKKCDFPWIFLCLPEGIHHFSQLPLLRSKPQGPIGGAPGELRLPQNLWVDEEYWVTTWYNHPKMDFNQQYANSQWIGPRENQSRKPIAFSTCEIAPQGLEPQVPASLNGSHEGWNFQLQPCRHLTMVDYHGLIMVDMSNGIIINGIMDHQYFYPLVIKHGLLENPSFGSMISHETTTRNLHLVRGFHTTQPPQISHVIPEAPCHAPDFPSGGESGLIPTPVWVGLILEENPSMPSVIITVSQFSSEIAHLCCSWFFPMDELKLCVHMFSYVFIYVYMCSTWIT